MLQRRNRSGINMAALLAGVLAVMLGATQVSAEGMGEGRMGRGGGPGVGLKSRRPASGTSHGPDLQTEGSPRTPHVGSQQPSPQTGSRCTPSCCMQAFPCPLACLTITPPHAGPPLRARLPGPHEWHQHSLPLDRRAAGLPRQGRQRRVFALRLLGRLLPRGVGAAAV